MSNENSRRGQILKALEGYGREEGIAFMSFEDSVSYWRGLVEIIENLLDGEGKSTQNPSNLCTCVDIDFGTYKRAVSMKTPEGKLVGIDVCIAREIGELWLAGIKTINSCCGHGKLPPSVIVAQKDIGKMEELGYLHEMEVNQFNDDRIFRLV